MSGIWDALVGLPPAAPIAAVVLVLVGAYATIKRQGRLDRRSRRESESGIVETSSGILRLARQEAADLERKLEEVRAERDRARTERDQAHRRAETSELAVQRARAVSAVLRRQLEESQRQARCYEQQLQGAFNEFIRLRLASGGFELREPGDEPPESPGGDLRAHG